VEDQAEETEMNREEREQFVRHQVFAEGTWEAAVQAIVDRWESDVEQSRSDAAAIERTIHTEY
jgi:hypothetical protein